MEGNIASESLKNDAIFSFITITRYAKKTYTV